VGPEYLGVVVAVVLSSFSGGSWAMTRIMVRHKERIEETTKYTIEQKNRIDALENQINRMPLDYVLKVDFLREIQDMHENFRQINNKLDKLMERLFSK
jgi:hypothetical protein